MNLLYRIFPRAQKAADEAAILGHPGDVYRGDHDGWAFVIHDAITQGHKRSDAFQVMSDGHTLGEHVMAQLIQHHLRTQYERVIPTDEILELYVESLTTNNDPNYFAFQCFQLATQ